MSSVAKYKHRRSGGKKSETTEPSLVFFVKLLEICHASQEKVESMAMQMASKQLNTAAKNMAHFSHSMSIIMANCDYSSAVRLGAAIELNKLLQMITFYMSHENMQKQFLTNVPAKVRSQIKTNVMSVLPITSSDGPLLDNVCLCLAKFAIIHLEEKSCSDILAKLVSIVIEGTDKEKEEAIAAINRICIMNNSCGLRFAQGLLEDHADAIFTATVACFSLKERSDRLLKSALNAMARSFKVTWPLAIQQDQCKLVVQTTLTAAQSPDINVRTGSLYLLKEIVSSDYKLVEDSINMIMPIATEAIQSNDKRVRRMGARLWLCVLEVENPIMKRGKSKMVESLKEPVSFVNKKASIENILQLVSVLTAIIEEGTEAVAGDFDEEDSEDAFFSSTEDEDGEEVVHDLEGLSRSKDVAADWHLSDWVALCICYVCTNYPDVVDGFCLPYILSFLKDSNWRKRNAAVNLLLIVVVSQKGVDHTASLLKPYIPWIQTLTRDKESFKISIKAHRVLKAVFDRFPSLVPEETELKNLVTTIHLYMAESLDIVNKRHEKKLDHLTSSADYVWADTLDSLIGASFKNASKELEEKRPKTFALSPFYKKITEQLCAAAENRFIFAFKSLCLLLASTPEDCYSLMLDTTDDMLAFLRNMIELSDFHKSECDCHEHIQQLICEALPQVMKALKPGDTTTVHLHNKFFTCLLDILQRCHRNEKGGRARKDALVALSDTIPLLSQELKRHISCLVACLKSSLRSQNADRENAEEILRITVELIGSFFEFAESNAAAPHFKSLMASLLARMEDKKITLKVRAEFINAIGKLAEAVGRQRLHPYIPTVLRHLNVSTDMIATTTFNSQSEDDEEEEKKSLDMDKLRDSCFKTYSCLIRFIFQRIDPKMASTERCATQKLLPLCLDGASKLVANVINGKDLPFETRNVAAQLVGNILAKFEDALAGLGPTSDIKELLTETISRKGT